jgi:hypothetical protein
MIGKEEHEDSLRGLIELTTSPSASAMDVAAGAEALMQVLSEGE